MAPSVRAWPVCGEGATVQRPGGPHTTGGGAGAHVEPAAQPPSGGAGLDALLGAGGPPGVQVGQLSQPVAFQAVHQPPQHHDPFGQGGVGQPVRVLVGQLLEFGHQRRQPGRCPGRVAGRMGVRVHGRQPINPPPEHKHQPENVENPAVTDFTSASSREASLALSWEPRCSARPFVRGRPSCQASAWGPKGVSTMPGDLMGRSRPGYRVRRVRGQRSPSTKPGTCTGAPREPAGAPSNPTAPGRDPRWGSVADGDAGVLGVVHRAAGQSGGATRRPRSPPRRGWRGWWRGRRWPRRS